MKKSRKSAPVDVNRRDFLKGSSVATLMSMLGGIELRAQSGPEEPKKPEGPQVKIAVIGLGAWGRDVLATLGRLPQAEVAAICDTYPAFLKRSAKNAPKATAAEDYRKILDNKDITAIVVATPTHQHKDIVVSALQAGKHVYCEAPLANTIEDARAIAVAAREHPKQYFQSGLQFRADPQRYFLMDFVRSGALGPWVMVRSQWHKKQSWRQTSSNPDQEKKLNWRLDSAISPGLMGEIGVHHVDSAGWFLGAQPTAVTGFGSIRRWTDDGRNVPDTVQAMFEYPGGIQLMYDCTLANSFETAYEVFFGSDAAVMLRGNKAWLFKEVDSPLLGWEVYARKDRFGEETGIALVANATKIAAQGDNPIEDAPFTNTPLFYSLENFLSNAASIGGAVEDFVAAFDPKDVGQLKAHLAEVRMQPYAGFLEGYAATVIALKANEAITKGQKIEIKKEWLKLA